MLKKEIVQRYDEAEEAVFPEGEKLLLICVNKTIAIEDEAYTLLDRVRYSWKISPRKAEEAEYLLAVAHGLIVGFLKTASGWMQQRRILAARFPSVMGIGNIKRGVRDFVATTLRTRSGNVTLTNAFRVNYAATGAPFDT